VEDVRMVHDVAARREARGLKKKARELAGEARALEGIEGAALLAGEKVAEAARLRREAEELQGQARLEDLTVREEALIKTNKNGERKEYLRWVASWREGDRYRKVYLGSCRKMSQPDALQKARRMKAEALGYG
jgi:hypothetical protein